MGLTKQYLAYRSVETFNLIASGRGNVNFLVYNKTEGRYIAAPAAENVIIWDLRLGERVSILHRTAHEVTALRASPDRIHIAVGYSDGTVEIFDLQTFNSICSLALHKKAVSILRYDENGIRLVSGSFDNELVIVDVVEQAGQQRLIGHNGPITDAHFLQRLGENNILISASKDTQIKFWNLETQFCFKTIVDNRTEVWAIALIGNLLIAGCSESSMNVYRLKSSGFEASKNLESAIEGLSIEQDEIISPVTLKNCGVIQRASKGRVVSLVVDPSERIISCHGTNDLIEIFYVCTEDEAVERMKKRLKKIKKGTVNNVDSNCNDLEKAISLSDEIKRLESIKVKQKMKSIDIILGGDNELRLLVHLANNSLHLYKVNASLKKKQDLLSEGNKMLRALTRPGHQSEVRAVCFSSDSLAIGSGAGDSFKFWNRESMQCLRTLPIDYTLCCVFLPGDKYVLLGLKSGKLVIVDVGTADIIEEIPAHESEIWTIAVLPDQKGCVTGSSDATVKLWTFELVDLPSLKQQEVESPPGSVLSLLHKNTLQLEETVLCLQISPNMKYLAVGLLDSTVKVFFLDTFKYFLTLYGHKLPILCLDITFDTNLIATGSADRNVKIWGLDYGDCHRSIFAHDDSVMGLRFIPKTHMFFTCGKDGKIKQWDADSFEKILTLPGHIGEASNLAVSSNGKYLVTCGSDHTIRLYERTNEILVLQDVQEEEREELENQQLATGESSSLPLLPGLKLPSRKTVGSEKAAESILECLEICKQFEDTDSKINLHPLMQAYKVTNADDFLLITIKQIRASDLEEALLLLPFNNVSELLERLPRLIKERGDELELICKVIMFLFKVHMKCITSTKSLKPLLEKLIIVLKTDVNALRNVIGENLYGLTLLHHTIEEKEGVKLFLEANRERDRREKNKREPRKRVYVQMT